MKRTILALAVLSLAWAVAPAAAQTWNIDGTHSQTSFAVKHLMVATVRGEFGKTSGTVEYDGKNLSSVKVNATIDVTTIEHARAEARRAPQEPGLLRHRQVPDRHLRLEAGRGGGAGKFKLVGDLTLHGVTKEVALDVDRPDARGEGVARRGARRRHGDDDDQPQGLRDHLEPGPRRRRRGRQRRSAADDRPVADAAASRGHQVAACRCGPTPPRRGPQACERPGRRAAGRPLAVCRTVPLFGGCPLTAPGRSSTMSHP